jgi:IS605 OrfB family transposase
VHFSYGHDQVIKAIQSCQPANAMTSKGVPISYRFKRDTKGWRLFISLPIEKQPLKSSEQKGVIGLDINADHLALVETDRFGNPLTKKRIPLNTYGKNKNQSQALIGNACAQVIHFAKTAGKPIVIEQLEFQKKKAELKECTTPRIARMLSSLSYNHIKNGLRSRGWRQGIEVLEVNPAFTSLIGRIKFSKRYGLTIHQAAALAIGRRQLKASERIPRHLDSIPDGKGGHVALPLPVRNRGKHVWSTWGIINRKLKTALAAHFRAIKHRSLSSKPADAINTIPKIAGEIPARESVNKTARLTCLDLSTTTNV